MEYQLLVHMDVLVILDAAAGRERTRLLTFFEQLRAYPENYTEAVERDNVGRNIQIASHGNWQVYYWTDFADRHVKVLKLVRIPAARRRKQ